MHKTGASQKKRWAKPELVVLVRPKSEEAVLAACKIMVTFGGSSSVLNSCVCAYVDSLHNLLSSIEL